MFKMVGNTGILGIKTKKLTKPVISQQYSKWLKSEKVEGNCHFFVPQCRIIFIRLHKQKHPFNYKSGELDRKKKTICPQCILLFLRPLRRLLKPYPHRFLKSDPMLLKIQSSNKWCLIHHGPQVSV